MLNIMLFMLLSINMDYATFRYSDTLTILELYIAVPYSSFQYYEYEDKHRADYNIGVTIKTVEGDTIAHDEFERVSFLTSLTDAEERKLTIIDQFAVNLPAGKYEASIITKQDEGEESVNSLIDVPLYPQNKLSISDLELVSEVSEVETATRFTKGNRNLIPNPERVYGEKRSILYIYAELYGLSPSEEYTLVYRLTDTMGNIVNEYPEKKSIAQYPYERDVSGINTVGISPGSYIMTLQLAQDKDTVYSSKTFHITAKEEMYSILKGKEEEYYSFIKYIATDEELSRFKETQDRKAFLEVFWLKKGEDALNRFIEIAKKADELYGKETDMGRIYITHGPPDEITTFTGVPYYPDNIVWLYYSGGGKIFVFADLNRVGRFEIVYSNYEREYTNPNYSKYLNPDVLNIITGSDF